MTEPSDAVPADRAAATARPASAGGLLRQARQAQGLHIAALAAAIKVVPRKLELLENDQFDQLPDATFTRALAQTVCRTLKIDPVPVLALLPPPLHAYRLEQVAEGLKTPFHERPGRLVPRDWTNVASPVLWIAALIVVLTVAVYVLPAQWLPFGLGSGNGNSNSNSPRARSADAPVAESPAASDSGVPAPPATAAAPDQAAPAENAGEAAEALAPPGDNASEPAAAETQAASASAPAGPGVLQVHTTAPSWIGVTDAHGQALISRVVEAGEDVPIDGPMPFKVTIGNANATRIVFKGQALALAAFTRNNVARLELK